MKQETEENWDLVIRPKTGLFELHLRDLWRYRDLLFLLVRRDFVSVYKQTLLGPVWMLLQPLIMMVTFTFIFGNLAGISTDDLPQPLFYLAGITAWNYFSACFTTTSSVFTSNAAIFGKVYFPRLIIPLSVVVSNLIKFVLQLVLLVCVTLYYIFAKDYNYEASWTILYLPLIILLLAMVGLGLGLIITTLTTKYRDFTFLIGFGVQLLMYASPVIFPLSAVSGKLKAIIMLNPVTGLIEGFRYATLGRGQMGWDTMGYSAGFAALVLFIGVLLFNRAEKTFVDTV